MHRPVPDEIRRFILTSVPSVPYVEALLLMHAESTTNWDAPMLASRLYLPRARVEELLSQLAAAGFAVGVRVISYGLIIVAIWQKNRR